MAFRLTTPPFLQRHANRLPECPAHEARSDTGSSENPLVARLRQECGALTVEYRTPADFGCDPGAGFWVHLADWPLPAGMSRPSAPLIVLVPAEYPQAVPTAFFLPGDVTAKVGWTPAHLFPATSATAPEPWQACGTAALAWRENDDLLRLLATVRVVMECAGRLI